YVALSHRWGPPDKHPLCTTKATLAQHLLQIPWHHLPQTFQDSILLCIDLSIRYLWIDSLCIVQDNEEDWRRESKIMGSIYECAQFTIAASSAINTTERLFKVRKSLNLVEIPYNEQIGKGQRTDLVFAYIEPDMEKCLSLSPLNQRAWVMQEFYLSRRTVHFTKYGLVWSCKNGKRPQTRHMRSEFGSSWETVFEDDWKTLVQSYTRRELTYKSDKLVALEGLARKFRYQNPDEQMNYRYGLWLGDQPHALLWYGEGRLARDVGNSVPSWSWASTTGPISF
ncbi:HET-domain-containing protein, partial [Stipitochalara longipes BDJ]